VFHATVVPSVIKTDLSDGSGTSESVSHDLVVPSLPKYLVALPVCNGKGSSHSISDSSVLTCKNSSLWLTLLGSPIESSTSAHANESVAVGSTVNI
jgi:hypothetical protein